MSRFFLVGILVVLVMTTGCARTPKKSYADRVRAICGPEISVMYENTKWRDRDYAHDALLTSCMAFGTRR